MKSVSGQIKFLRGCRVIENRKNFLYGTQLSQGGFRYGRRVHKTV